MAINQFKMALIQSFQIFTNLYNCLYCNDVLLAQITRILLSIDVVSNGNKLSNKPKFCDKSTKYLQIFLYNLALKLLLNLNFKIITTECTLIITAFSTNVKPLNSLR